MTRNKWHEPSILCPRELKGLLRAIQGVDSQRLDAQGRNFMHLVVTGATDDCAARLIPFLVMAGANINQKDENGQNGVTPLYCRRGQKHRLLGPRQFCCRRSIARLRCRPGADGWTLAFDSHTSNPDWDCSGPLLVSDATPLLFAAAHAQGKSIIHCLLVNGADPNKPVRNKENMCCNKDKVEMMLGALFCHWWHTPGRIRSASWDVARPIIEDFLSFGAILDAVDEEPSALEYACGFPAVPGAGDHDLLIVLLGKSQRRNVSYEHLQKVTVDVCRRLWSTPPRTETSRYLRTITMEAHAVSPRDLSQR
ncbi:hypothetical protein FP744_10001592 [Trichoderma asperellum]